MDWYGLFACTVLFLCSADGINAVIQFSNWLKYKFN